MLFRSIVFLALSISLWVFLHRATRVVRAAQPIFLHVLVLGVAIFGVAIVPLSFDQGSTETLEGCNVACRSFPWFLSVGFSLAFSALWAKTHRVNCLMQTPSFRRIIVTPLDVTKPILVVLLTNVIVLSLWTALAPLQCATEVTAWDGFDRPTDTHGFCYSEQSLPFLIALGVINLGPLIFAAYEAYVARNVSTEYSETDYILKALIVICMVCFVGIPVIIITYDNPAAYFFGFSSIIFVVCISLLMLIFGPKLAAYYDLKEWGRTTGTLPDRFSRGNSSNLATSNQVTRNNLDSDTSSFSGEGLVVLNNDKTLHALQEEIKALQEEIEKLKMPLGSNELNGCEDAVK